MFNYTKTSLLFISFFFCQTLFSQEQLGLRLGNYAGISGVRINPTSGVNNPLGWDANIVSLGGFLANDYIFIKDASMPSFFRNLSTLGPAPETKITVPTQPTQFFDFFNRKRDKFISSSAFVGLPSFQLNLESGHTFGVFFEQRSGLSTRNIPIIADPYEQKIPLNLRYEVQPLVITGMAWGELGFNYAYQIGNEAEGGLSFGVTAKVLRANQGFFVQNLDGTAFTRLTKDSTRIDALNVRVGFTNNFMDKPLSNNGLGFGFDLGAQFVLGSGELDNRPYLFRLGASILDIGHVNFTKNAQVHAVKLTEPLQVDSKKYQNLNPTAPEEDAIHRFNQTMYGKADSSLQGHYFAIGLPSAISFQGDLAITDKFFINGLLIQRLQMSHFSISRDNVFAVTPRFESQWLGASLPLSILNYSQVRLGLAARLAFLTVGTDHLLSFLGEKRLSGSDFYVALKINAFTLGKLGSNGGFWVGNRGGKKAKCYRF